MSFRARRTAGILASPRPNSYARLAPDLGKTREEAAFDVRMRQFSNEEGLFDEQDRRVRLSVSGRALSEPPVAATNGEAGPSAQAAGAPPSSLGSNKGPTDDVGSTNNFGASQRPLSGSDYRPEIGSSGARGAIGDSVPALEAEQKRLRALAEEIRLRAAALQQKVKPTK